MKIIAKTVQTITRTYYVDGPRDKVDRAADAGAEHFVETYGDENIVSTTMLPDGVDFPTATMDDNVNGAVNQYNAATDRWEPTARWELVK